MIQRIQTVFLLLAVIASAAMFFFPFATAWYGQVEVSLEAFQLKQAGIEEVTEPIKMALVPLLGVLSSLLLVIFVVSISRYKNRILQLRLLMINMLVNLALVALIFILIRKLEAPAYGVSTYLTLFTMLMITLSNRFIRKDEAKVRAADRLR
jgi:glucan phosphoethanolaminetransferase (alkaline phosphatase superfamily)